MLPEMLEHILSFLPFKHLLLVQGVSNTFRVAVGASKKLQQKLQLIAMKNVEVQEIPILPSDFSNLCTPSTRHHTEAYIDLRLHNATQCCTTTRGCGASWRGMFVTQPPVKSMEVDMFPETRGIVLLVDDLISEEGITLGQMIDHAYTEAGKSTNQLRKVTFDFDLREANLAH